MDQGWVYVLVNSTIPDLAKVGCTTRSTAERAAELSRATGVATPFIVAFDRLFEDCGAAEHAIHAELVRRGMRVADNREFFRGSASEIIRVVLEAGDVAGRSVEDVQAPGTGDALLAAGDRAMFGLGETMQDRGEAARLYRLAASRGALIAFERLGQIYRLLYQRSKDRVGRRRLMAALKEGARRGNYYCYVEMAAVFAMEGHPENFLKAWALFFDHHGNAPLAVLEADSERLTKACCRYVSLCLELGFVPGNAEALNGVASQMVTALHREFAALQDDPTARKQVAAVLRWVNQLQLPPPAEAAPRSGALRRLSRLWNAQGDVSERMTAA